MTRTEFLKIARLFGLPMAETAAKLHGIALAQRQLWALSAKGGDSSAF